jgi:antitoxin (DNA-binding transcriptional repressor) of toxin-antitoxin stability system
MDTVDLAHARDHLPELIERAARGEDVRIADPVHGTVRLSPVPPKPKSDRYVDTLPPFVPRSEPRVLGRLEGIIKVPDDIMDPMTEEELRLWYGDDE